MCPPPPGHSSCLGLQVSPQVGNPQAGWHHTHRSDVAAIGGSREDLELELQLPDKQDPVSAWAWGQPGPLSPCHPAGRDHARKVPEPCRTLNPIPFRGHGEMPWRGMEHLLPTPAMTPKTPGDPLDPTMSVPGSCPSWGHYSHVRADPAEGFPPRVRLLSGGDVLVHTFLTEGEGR